MRIFLSIEVSFLFIFSCQGMELFVQKERPFVDLIMPTLFPYDNPKQIVKKPDLNTVNLNALFYEEGFKPHNGGFLTQHNLYDRALRKYKAIDKQGAKYLEKRMANLLYTTLNNVLRSKGIMNDE